MSRSMNLVCSSMSTESNSLMQTLTMASLPVPVDLVSTFLPTDTVSVYIKRVKGIAP